VQGGGKAATTPFYKRTAPDRAALCLCTRHLSETLFSSIGGKDIMPFIP